MEIALNIRKLLTTTSLAAMIPLALAACSTQDPPSPASTSSVPTDAATNDDSPQSTVSPAAERAAAPAPAEFFTGEVMLQPLYDPNEYRTTGAGEVTFPPSARSHWHSHPVGQTLIVTAGIGWVQDWNGERREMAAGDVIWTPPGVKHWHGATTTGAMTHINVTGFDGDTNVEWLEEVTDAQYAG
jgi:quercetin dioxygenase-like cupin family protein